LTGIHSTSLSLSWCLLYRSWCRCSDTGLLFLVAFGGASIELTFVDCQSANCVVHVVSTSDHEAPPLYRHTEPLPTSLVDSVAAYSVPLKLIMSRNGIAQRGGDGRPVRPALILVNDASGTPFAGAEVGAGRRCRLKAGRKSQWAWRTTPLLPATTITKCMFFIVFLLFFSCLRKLGHAL